jgi:hypothetical protein
MVAAVMVPEEDNIRLNAIILHTLVMSLDALHQEKRRRRCVAIAIVQLANGYLALALAGANW